MKKKLTALVIAMCMTITTMPIISYGNSSSQSDVSVCKITSFMPLEDDIYSFSGTPTEEELVANFPSVIEARTDAGIVNLPVVWTSNGTYNQYDYYMFEFEPVIGGELPEGVQLPRILAFRTEDAIEAPVEEDEQIDLDSDLENAKDMDVSFNGILDSIADSIGLYSYAATSASDEVYNFLTENMGLNMAAACGVATNLFYESGFAANNLENYYEAKDKLNMSDSEYTSKVNSGEYTRKQFVNDSAGYGLCQWTSAGRKGKLYDFAKEYFKSKDKKFNIGNRAMQLEYFKKEVTESYPVTYNTATKVPNIEMGAFLTAFVMCTNFEIPADTANTSNTRGKAALDGGTRGLTVFWEKYSGEKSNYDELTYLGICGFTYPTKIDGGVSCRGYVVSNKGINSVTAKITDSKGKDFCSFTKDYSKKDDKPYYYNLNGDVDDKMSFTKLASEGNKGETYTYSVEAIDINGRSTRFDKNFTISTNSDVKYDTVVIETSKMELKDATAPDKLKKGDNFEGTGLIESNYNITQVTVGVKDEKGKTVLIKKTVKPNLKSYDLQELIAQLDIYTLKGGKYIYYITAKDEDRSKNLLSEPFTIDSKKISSFNYPVSIAKGKSFDVKGKVKSDLKITQVYARVVNSKGKVVTKKIVTPNATTYALSKLSDYLKFSKLAEGTYTYKVRVTDAIGKTDVIDETFDVYAPSTLKGYKIAYPSSLKQGKGFTLSGRVKSNYNLKSITVYILSSKSKTVQSKKIDLSEKEYKSYALSNFDSDIKFGTLKKGTYYYKVSAKDERKSKQLLKKKFTVK